MVMWPDHCLEGESKTATIIDNQEARAQLTRKDRITDIVLEDGKLISLGVSMFTPLYFSVLNPLEQR
jgi:hypothetical protein